MFVSPGAMQQTSFPIEYNYNKHTLHNEIWIVTSLCSWTLVIMTTFSCKSQSSRVFIKHIQLHAKSKPTFTIACTIITVIMHAIPNRTLQLNPIKINNRNRIFNGRAKLGNLILLFQAASVSILIQLGVWKTGNPETETESEP